MAISTEIDFDYVNKIVHRHAAATTAIHTVNEAYTHIQDTFDELTEMDDKVPLSAATPTSYKLDNGWLIRGDVIEHFEGGAIETTGWSDEIHALYLDGAYTNFVEGDIGLQVQEDAGDVGELLDFDNAKKKIWVRIGSAAVIADNAAITISGGTGGGDALGASITGENLYSNPYSLGTIEAATSLYVYQDDLEVTSFWAEGHIDILLMTREAGSDIDSRYITVFGREWGDEGTSFNIQLTAAGQNAVPLGNKADSNNTSTNGDVEDLQDGTVATIAVTFEFTAPHTYDVGDGNGAKDYTIQIDCDGRRLSDVYEVTKYWTSENTSTILEVDSDGNAINGEAYRYARASYGTEVVSAPFGTFAGGKFFGAQGVYFINLHADDAQAFQLIDDSGASRIPPNYQAFSMGGVEAGWTVTVYESTGASSTVVDKEQQNLKTGANTLNELEVDTTIPSSTPSVGTIIVVDDNGDELAYAYTSYSGKVYSVSVAATTYSGDQFCYVPYLYATASGTSVSETTTINSADINVVGRARKAGYIPYEAAGTFGSTGYSATAIKTTDGIYGL